MIIKTKGKHAKSFKIGILEIIVFLCVLLSVFCTVTYAIFTSVRNAQRTIAAYDTEGERFSSNYLLKGDSKDNVRTVFTTSVSLPVVAVVTVCNYQQGVQTLPFDSSFTYTVTARLVKYDESLPAKYAAVDSSYLTSQSLTSYTVSISDGTQTRTLGVSNTSGTFSGSFSGGVSDSDAYTVSFSTGFAENKPNLYLEMIATPSTPLLSTIRSIFKPDLRAAGATDYWTGSFRDDTGTSPSSYDGYNYLITGTGSGNVTLTWDGTKIKLSDVSKDILLSVSGASQVGNSITFPVDSDEESRYDLQFYKVNIASETWSQMSSSVVTFSFS